MKPLLFKTCLLLAVALTGVGAFAQSNGAPGPQDYSSFSRFITDRNIFDPTRQPHYISTSHTHHSSSHHSHSNGIPGIQFVGTMSYEKGMFAFFNANSSDYKKALQVGGKIADYTVTEVWPAGVALESPDKKQRLLLKVGDGLKQENGKWVQADEGDLITPTSTTTTSSSSTRDSSSPTPEVPSSASEPNDILKRLMEQREKGN